MKELRISKYSKEWFRKRNTRWEILTIVLGVFIPILISLAVVFKNVNNIGLCLVFIFFSILDIILTDMILTRIIWELAFRDYSYDDYIYRLISEQKHKQDRKWKKWLI